MFYFVVDASCRGLGPLDHHEAFCHKKRPTHVLHRDGTAITELICGKGQELTQEFSKPLCDSQWAGSVFARAPEDCYSDLIELNVMLLLHNGAGYNRRIVRDMQRFLAAAASCATS